MRRMMPKTIAAFAVTAAMAAVIIVSPAPAAAALPRCNHFTTYRNNFNYQPANTAIVPSTEADSRDLNCILRWGDHSWGVWALQRALNICHNAGLAEDGIYGQLTYNAVVWMQASVGITVDGIYGPQTRRYAIKMPEIRLDGSLYRCTNYW